MKNIEELEDKESIEASNEILSDISKNNKHKSIMKDNIKMLIRKFIFIVLLFVLLFGFIFGFTRVNNISMSPSIVPGNLLLYYRLDKDYSIGDVVIFERNNKKYILRVIALENQVITLNSDDEFLIDGELETHKTYFENSFPIGSKVKYPYRVPKGKVFVVGDYRNDSSDSRSFGAIDKSIIKGKVISLLQTKDI